MTKYLKTFIAFIIIYFSFIDVTPTLYWMTTGLYTIVGTILVVGAVCLHNDKGTYSLADIKKQYGSWQQDKVLNTIWLTLLTSVLITTHNFYHLVFVFSILYFYYELSSANKRYFK
jgi:hypothetical protein